MAEKLNGATVLVLGASGQVGRFAVPLLLANGADVIAVSRGGRPPRYPGWEGVDWVMPENAIGLADRVTMILSGGPLALAIEWLARCPAVHRVAATSSTSVVTKRDSREPAERRQMTGLLEAETSLAEACAARAAGLCLLRPTLVYGAGLDRNLARLASFIRRFGFLPLARQSGGLRQPLHAEDLAAALVAGLVRGVDLLAPLAGGETVTYREMAGRVFDALDRPRRLAAVPTPLLSAVARLAGGGANAGMVERQAIDLVFDDAEAREALGIHPRGYRPGADDFSPPSRERLEALASGVNAG